MRGLFDLTDDATRRAGALGEHGTDRRASGGQAREVTRAGESGVGRTILQVPSAVWVPSGAVAAMCSAIRAVNVAPPTHE